MSSEPTFPSSHPSRFWPPISAVPWLTSTHLKAEIVNAENFYGRITIEPPKDHDSATSPEVVKEVYRDGPEDTLQYLIVRDAADFAALPLHTLKSLQWLRPYIVQEGKHSLVLAFHALPLRVLRALYLIACSGDACIQPLLAALPDDSRLTTYRSRLRKRQFVLASQVRKEVKSQLVLAYEAVAADFTPDERLDDLTNFSLRGWNRGSPFVLDTSHDVMTLVLPRHKVLELEGEIAFWYPKVRVRPSSSGPRKHETRFQFARDDWQSARCLLPLVLTAHSPRFRTIVANSMPMDPTTMALFTRQLEGPQDLVPLVGASGFEHSPEAIYSALRALVPVFPTRPVPRVLVPDLPNEAYMIYQSGPTCYVATVVNLFLGVPALRHYLIHLLNAWVSHVGTTDGPAAQIELLKDLARPLRHESILKTMLRVTAARLCGRSVDVDGLTLILEGNLRGPVSTPGGSAVEVLDDIRAALGLSSYVHFSFGPPLEFEKLVAGFIFVPRHVMLGYVNEDADAGSAKYPVFDSNFGVLFTPTPWPELKQGDRVTESIVTDFSTLYVTISHAFEARYVSPEKDYRPLCALEKSFTDLSPFPFPTELMYLVSEHLSKKTVRDTLALFDPARNVLHSKPVLKPVKQRVKLLGGT